MDEQRPDLASHAALQPRATAYGLAAAIADSWRPGRYVAEVDGYATVDIGAVIDDIPVVSAGEGVLLGIIRSLAGEGAVDLSRLDAVDPRHAALLADAFGVLARR